MWWCRTPALPSAILTVKLPKLGDLLLEDAGIEDTPAEVLFKKFGQKSVEPVLTEMRFPHYKSLAADLTISFSFPITALVGANGTNKSSILHAIQAAPEGRSVGDFWFSTAVDKIERRRLTGADRHRFIYKYRTRVGNKLVQPECRKSRVTRDYRSTVPKSLEGQRDPDVWEPTKLAFKGDRMTPPPPEGGPADDLLYDSRQRWKLIDKPVVYLDFRSELSAFDKFFYHSPFTQWSPNRARKKLTLVVRSNGLATAFNGEKPKKVDEGKVRERRELSAESILAVSKILGKNFTEIHLIRHQFYSAVGFSARMTLKGRTYSEAHAGSGEFAIVRLVDEVVEASPKSLIILDEPEVSLHPGAQRNLIRFLKKQCLANGHQIVMSTHSPTIISELPPEAVKLLGTRTGEGEVRLLSDRTLPGEAFFHLGHFTDGPGQKIVVEDELAAEIVSRAIRVFNPEYLSVIRPSIFPGGGDGILKNLLPAQALVASTDVTILLDGDKCQWGADWTQNESTNPEQAEIDWVGHLKRNLGLEPELFPDGAGGKADNLSRSRNAKIVAKWAKFELFHLHGLSPESALLYEMQAAESLVGPFVSAEVGKGFFISQTRKFHGKIDSEPVTAAEIFGYQKHEISKLDSRSALIRSANRAVERAISKM